MQTAIDAIFNIFHKIPNIYCIPVVDFILLIIMRNIVRNKMGQPQDIFPRRQILAVQSAEPEIVINHLSPLRICVIGKMQRLVSISPVGAFLDKVCILGQPIQDVFVVVIAARLEQNYAPKQQANKQRYFFIFYYFNNFMSLNIEHQYLFTRLQQ